MSSLVPDSLMPLAPPVCKRKLEILVAESGRRQCKNCVLKRRTAKVLFLKSDSKGSNPRVSRGLHTHTPPEGGINQMVTCRHRPVEVLEDKKRCRQLRGHVSTNGSHVAEKAIWQCRKSIAFPHVDINCVAVQWPPTSEVHHLRWHNSG